MDTVVTRDNAMRSVRLAILLVLAAVLPAAATDMGEDGMDDDEIHDLIAYVRSLCNK